MMKSLLKVSTSFNQIANSLVRCRQFHSTVSISAVEKSLLAKLRKKTGFSISQCKKALEQHDNDLEKAEEWIRKEAQSQGWSKAINLSNRVTSQGLVGVHVEQNVGALVEVNCETDFVARNTQFQDLVSQVAKEYALFGVKQEISDSSNINNTKEELESIQTQDGKKLSDAVALLIGTVGENMTLTRGTLLRSPPDSQILCYAHPSTSSNPKQYGRYGSLIALKNSPDNQDLGRELCAHIVGMNPKELGDMADYVETSDSESDSESSESKSDSTTNPKTDSTIDPTTDSVTDPKTDSVTDSKTDSATDKKSDSTSDSSSESSSSDEDVPRKPHKEENRFIFQEFLADPEQKVGDVLKENNIEILDFVRFEVGETVKNED